MDVWGVAMFISSAIRFELQRVVPDSTGMSYLSEIARGPNGNCIGKHIAWESRIFGFVELWK